MAKGDDIEERLIDFAVRIIRVCDALSNEPAERHIRSQLLRCGTSSAPSYGEARGAESSRDFVHKLKIVLKELNETRVWLQIMARAKFVPEKRMTDLLDECDQLCRIISASIQTAKRASH